MQKRGAGVRRIKDMCGWVPGSGAEVCWGGHPLAAGWIQCGWGLCSYRHAAAAATDDGGVSPLPALPSTAKAAVSLLSGCFFFSENSFLLINKTLGLNPGACPK